MWQYNYNTTDTTDTTALQHSGVIGMHWGHRKAQAISAKTGRKTGVIDSQESLATRVSKDRKEADDRVKFYGGKNVALNAIKQESKYQTLIGYADAFKKSAIGSAALGTGLTALMLATGGTAGVIGVGAAIIGGGTLLGGAGLGTVTKSAINAHAKTQSAYTVDSKQGVNNVVAQYKH